MTDQPDDNEADPRAGRRAVTQEERSDGTGKALLAIFGLVAGGALVMGSVVLLMFGTTWGDRGDLIVALGLATLAAALLVPSGLYLRQSGQNWRP
jgi:hypothetical protein